MQIAIHPTIAGRSSGAVIITDRAHEQKVRSTLREVRFSELDAETSYCNFFLDLFFDNPAVQVFELTDIPIS